MEKFLYQQAVKSLNYYLGMASSCEVEEGKDFYLSMSDLMREEANFWFLQI